ncbi:uncharacterized protein LOC114653834 [Erpetoichthys calabaricus]|uniref:uncharacterized protein LOC114653834 n=1 Tax=Erpetoichthys calabaricus TaxID=27687 RepID=UPI002234E77D|nr:uncharacterized protein LOC114653834 [Erpetoichthys calabaricus]
MSSQEVQKAVLSISTAEEVRQETTLLMKPYANWEEFLMPGPLSIAILGELVFISSKDDFSINKNPPKDGFKYIRYPESFRACLMQVTNSGWLAFNEAHKNMDQIRLHSFNIPGYVKMTVKTLLQDNLDLVKALLPGQLQNIHDIAKECTRLADSTEKKFMDVILLIQEILEACMNAKLLYEEDLKNIKLKLEEAQMKKASTEMAKKLAEENLTRMTKQLDEAQDQFKKAMDSMPSGWEIIGMNFVEGLADSVNSLISGAVSVLSSPGKITSAVKGSTGSESTPVKSDNPMAVNNIYSKSAQLLKLSQQLQTFVEKDQIKWNEIYDEKNESAKSDWIKKQYEDIEKSVQGEEECKPKGKVLEICQAAVSICKLLTQYAPKKDCPEEEKKKILTQISSLKDSCEVFDSESKAFTNSSAFPATPPNIVHQASDGKKSAGEMASENARFKIEQSKAQLQQVQDMYQKSMENLEKNNKELTEILVTMHSCQVKEIDFDTTVKMLVKGLDAMGRVKEQWEKMVHFFQMISNLISTCLNTTLNQFVTSAESLKSVTGYNSNRFVVDMIYTQAFQASNIANLVHMIAETYTEVSNLYLMDKVSSLGKLMALDPNNPQFESERGKLASDCESAQNGIKNLVLKNKEEFESSVNSRVQKIESELQSVLPPISDVEQKKIQSNISTGIKNVSKEDEGQFE